MDGIYLDYNATTPIDPAVAKAMLPYVHGRFGNPSSGHAFGLAAREGVDLARQQVAGMLGCSADDLIFTSGGTEANNHAIKGVAGAHRHRGSHIITSAVEHPAVTEVCHYLEGARVSAPPTSRSTSYGMVDPRQVEEAITPETVLVTIMHANNEVGTHPAHRGDRRNSPPTRRPGAQRLRPVHRQDSRQGGRPRRRSALRGRAQALCPQGHRRAVHPSRRPAGKVHARRQPRGQPPRRHRKHHPHGRPGQSLRAHRAQSVRITPTTWPPCATAWSKASWPRAMMSRVNGHPTERLPNTCSVGFRGLEADRILANSAHGGRLRRRRLPQRPGGVVPRARSHARAHRVRHGYPAPHRGPLHYRRRDRPGARRNHRTWLPNCHQSTSLPTDPHLTGVKDDDHPDQPRRP